MNQEDNGKILIVDDEKSAIKVLSAILTDAGYSVVPAIDADEAMNILSYDSVDAVITDIKMPGKDGFELFEQISKHSPDLPVIFLTAYGSVDSAVSAMTNGAFYYFIKPPNYTKLKSILGRAVEQHRLKREVEELRNKISKRNNAFFIVGNTPPMTRIYKTIDTLKDSESSVFIYGETGTGKELIAKKLHFCGKRSRKPFIAFNCASMPRDLIESELFGYEKGAFTGAVSTRIGKFEEASGGTVFLDEIGELELSLQAKLLRVLQEREIERLGSNKKIKVDFRLITSTNRNLFDEIKEGRFRKDLYYRINVVQIEVPPLRDRLQDVPLLATAFMNEFCAREKKLISIPENIMELLKNYTWPGNVRQLRNVIERAVVLSHGKSMNISVLPKEISIEPVGSQRTSKIKSLKDIEYNAILKTLSVANGNKSKAARQLGISRKSLYKRLRDYNIQ